MRRRPVDRGSDPPGDPTGPLAFGPCGLWTRPTQIATLNGLLAPSGALTYDPRYEGHDGLPRGAGDPPGARAAGSPRAVDRVRPGARRPLPPGAIPVGGARAGAPEPAGDLYRHDEVARPGDRGQGPHHPGSSGSHPGLRPGPRPADRARACDDAEP